MSSEEEGVKKTTKGRSLLVFFQLADSSNNRDDERAKVDKGLKLNARASIFSSPTTVIAILSVNRVATAWFTALSGLGVSSSSRFLPASDHSLLFQGALPWNRLRIFVIERGGGNVGNRIQWSIGLSQPVHSSNKLIFEQRYRRDNEIRDLVSSLPWNWVERRNNWPLYNRSVQLRSKLFDRTSNAPFFFYSWIRGNICQIINNIKFSWKIRA